MANVKGAAWLCNYDYFLKLGGPEGMQRVKAALKPEDQNILNTLILPSTWVDWGFLMRFKILADKLLGKGDSYHVKQASIYTAQQALGGIHRVFIKLATPQFIIARTGQIWRQYYDCGTAEVVKQTKTGGTLMLGGMPDIPLYHEMDNLPYMEEALRMSGSKKVTSTQSKCMARGDDCCLLEFTWA
ncbi:MAG: hypothetical protein HGA76_10195 [Candidatus Firestonebacteria bacterium]|nr:hypothetical protein [Candidatus Firestonebacteria bacterium]